MNAKGIDKVYFLGIGGIGMSALARYFHANGKKIAGYDRTRTSLTRQLEKSGMQIHYKDEVGLIPDEYKNPTGTLVVYTPALPQDHNELNWFYDHNFEIIKRASVLGTIANNMKGIAVAGTHGKTSVSSMISWILQKSEFACSAFLGGISKNLKSNFLANTDSDYIVVEADEFDRSFLHLTPEYGIITAIDADHLDIYGTYHEMLKSFEQFIALIKPGGTLLINEKYRKLVNVPSYLKVFTYSLDDTADYNTENLHIVDGKFSFDVKLRDHSKVSDIMLGLPGRINVENALAAMAIATVIGVDESHIRKQLKTYQGVSRRFDYQINTEKVVYIDDYAHHPEELSATIESVKQLYPNKKLTGVFQPHLYSRTKDFASEFAVSLDKLDEVLLLDIYPAREEPLEGITSDIIYDQMESGKKTRGNLKNAIELLAEMDVEILLTLGAGNIDTLVKPITKMLKEKYQIK